MSANTSDADPCPKCGRVETWWASVRAGRDRHVATCEVAEPRPAPRVGSTNLDWAKAVLATELPSRSKLVACAIAFVTPRKTMTCWPGKAYLCDKTSLHRDTVKAALTDLTSAGWLIRLSHGSNTHGNRAAVYRLSFRPANKVGD